jgi:hypothetical protein
LVGSLDLRVTGGGDRNSREALVVARERERQVVQLYIRGLSWIRSRVNWG